MIKKIPERFICKNLIHCKCLFVTTGITRYIPTVLSVWAANSNDVSNVFSVITWSKQIFHRYAGSVGLRAKNRLLQVSHWKKGLSFEVRRLYYDFTLMSYITDSPYVLLIVVYNTHISWARCCCETITRSNLPSWIVNRYSNIFSYS